MQAPWGELRLEKEMLAGTPFPQRGRSVDDEVWDVAPEDLVSGVPLLISTIVH